MDEILIIIKEYFTILAEPTIALLIGIFTILVTKNSNRYSVARDRLTYAYHPIFLSAEHYHFKKIDITFARLFIDKYSEIESKYSLYIYPSLRYWIHLLSNSVNNEDDNSTLNEYWFQICHYIDKDYDRLCKKAHMPIRSTAYRLNNNQFSSKPSLYWGMFKLFILPIICFILMIFIFLIVMSYLE